LQKNEFARAKRRIAQPFERDRAIPCFSSQLHGVMSRASALQHFYAITEEFTESLASTLLSTVKPPNADAKRLASEANGAQICSEIEEEHSRILCRYCFKSRYNHPFNNKSHLALCEEAPQELREAHALLVQGKKSLRCGPDNKLKLAELASNAQSRQSTGYTDFILFPSSLYHSLISMNFIYKVDSKPIKRKAEPNILRDYGLAKLKSPTVSDIDDELADFIFTRALPFSILDDGRLQRIIHAANPSYISGTMLSSWTLRHDFLNKHSDAITTRVKSLTHAAHAKCVITDGWSGIQRRHLLNILLTTPKPVFIANIETGEHSVTSEYQAQELRKVAFNEEWGPIDAICTDFASVMRATWRHLRRDFPSLLTYGCSCHAIQLLGKDISKHPDFSLRLDEAVQIVSYFRSHLRGNGLPTLRRVISDLKLAKIELKLPNQTRWNSQLACAESVHSARPALVLLTISTAWRSASTEQMKNIERIICDSSFWETLEHFIQIASDIRIAIEALQSDTATMSDVYTHVVLLHQAFSASKYSEWCLKHWTKRFTFMIHPAHAAAFLLDNRHMRISNFKPSNAAHLLNALVVYMRPGTDPTQVASEVADFLAQLKWSVEGKTQGTDWFNIQRTSLPALTWWVSVSDIWPNLYEVAVKLHSLPSSAAAAERLWSCADTIITRKRNKLTPEASDKLMSIYFNSRILASVNDDAPVKPLFSAPLTFIHPELDFSLISALTNEDISPTADSDTDEESANPPTSNEEESASEITMLQPMFTTRAFPGPIKPSSSVLVAPGVEAYFWYSSDPGWYLGTIGDFNDVAKRYTIEFSDGSFDYFDLGTTSRHYGAEAKWVVPALDEALSLAGEHE
jgi:hypothetical protein